jgi:DNA-binding response OmpR family regulator
MPCERMASAVSALPDVAYVLISNDAEAGSADEYDEWVDAIVRSPAHHHEICEAGERALLRKAGRPAPRAIAGAHTFAWMGYTAELSSLESRLMRRLVHARGAVVSKEALAYDLWGTYMCDPGRAIDAHVYRIRKGIEGIPGVELVTVRKRGFRLLLSSD